MALTGKGMMIWKIPSCEEGNPSKIASVAKAAGFTHVLIKIADGTYSYNVNRTTNIDLVPPVVSSLKAQGLKVWGWHYIYGDNPACRKGNCCQDIYDRIAQRHPIPPGCPVLLPLPVISHAISLESIPGEI